MTNQEAARQLIIDALKIAPGPVRGASFKLRYLRQLKPDFEEREFGYRTLRAFLEAFPDIVRVEHDGMDIVVLPAGSKDIKRVRPDLWRAFTFVDSTVDRYFDRESDAAVLLAQEPTTNEPERLQDVRRRLEANPDNFFPIKPIETGTQLEQMRRFVAGISDQRLRDELTEALNAQSWFKAFTATLEQRPTLLHAWRIQWSEFVIKKITEWSNDSQVSLSNVIIGTIHVPVDRSASVDRSRDTKQRSTYDGQRIDIDVEELRARVIRAVSSMSAAQLLALPIPLEHLLRNN